MNPDADTDKESDIRFKVLYCWAKEMGYEQGLSQAERIWGETEQGYETGGQTKGRLQGEETGLVKVKGQQAKMK